MSGVPSVTLNNGVTMPILGFGVFRITDLEECERSVYEAIRAGYRLIDTAAMYRNEEAVGRAIRRAGVAREELFITTKLWIQDAGYDPAREAFELSLTRLGIDYLDLYLIHQPYGDIYGAWRAMQELLLDGRVRAIGVSNFQPDRVMDLILHSEVTPQVNQVELHPFYQQVETQQFLKEYGVQTESWGPFAAGRNNLFQNDVLRALAAIHQKSVAQIVLRWLIQRGVVAIPKSVHKDRIIENFDVFGFELSADEMAQIASLDQGVSSFLDHRDPAEVRRLSSLHLHD